MATPYIGLSQQQRQIMTLAPQLRQSLEMLQMPVLELRAAILKEMSINPAIEDVTNPSEERLSEVEPDTYSEEHPTDDGLDFDPDIDLLLRQDDHWRDYFLQGMENADSFEEAESRRQYLFDSIRHHVSLQEHLVNQLALTEVDTATREIALLLIGNINEDGYFTGSLPDLIMVSERSEEQLLEILALIQQFDPAGVGARDLRECLMLQLDKLAASPWLEEVRLLIDRHLEKLARRDDTLLCRELGLKPHELEEVVQLVRGLNPRPGRDFSSETSEYVEPEVFVERDDQGRLNVLIDDSFVPHIRISNYYRRMLEDKSVSAEAKSYIRERIRAGAFLIRSIHQRQDTIRKISSEIVKRQAEFMTRGISALRPMTMSDVADAVGVHETTVSRTVANKYMRTPVGVFEMKFFFTTGLQHKDGSVISNRSVQEIIQQMIESEAPQAPLSDQSIQELLAERGIKIARRTVAKYRGILKIPPSHKRRRG